MPAAGLPAPRGEQPAILRQRADDYSGLSPMPVTADQRSEEGSLHSPAPPRLQRQRTERAKAMARFMGLREAGLDVQTSAAMRTLTAGDATRHMRTAGGLAQTSTQLDADLLSALEELIQTRDLTVEQKEKYWHLVASGGLGLGFPECERSAAGRSGGLEGALRDASLPATGPPRQRWPSSLLPGLETSAQPPPELCQRADAG
eukprot:9031455-Pyramimonas_sp.AAC.1